MMGSLSKFQKTFGAAVLGISVSCVTVVAAVYWPQKLALLRAESELLVLKSQVEQVDLIADDGRVFGERLRQFRAKVDHLIAKFPAQEKEALKAIAQIAPQFKLTLVSLQSQPKENVYDASSQPLQIDGKNCQTTLVTLEVRGRYLDLVHYLDELKEQLPYFTVNRFTIVRDSVNPAQVHAHIAINLYLLSL